MALTAEGAALTEAHRLGQLAVAAKAAAAATNMWDELEASRLDATSPLWLARSLRVVQRFNAQSASLAQRYVPMYRDAELGSSAGRVVAPEFELGETSDALLVAGPVRVKLLTRGGMTGDAAHASALTKFTGIVRRQVLSGGRMLIYATTKSDSRAIGWRRKTDGNPCAFCAMLASRGPVYGSRERAEQIGGTGLHFHGHCGCTAEIIYGEWKPSDAEQRYIEEYDKAARLADAAGEPRTQQTVLYRMRNNGVFRDSPLSRNTTTA